MTGGKRARVSDFLIALSDAWLGTLYRVGTGNMMQHGNKLPLNLSYLSMYDTARDCLPACPGMREAPLLTHRRAGLSSYRIMYMDRSCLMFASPTPQPTYLDVSK